jgi:hypothetical protein
VRWRHRAKLNEHALVLETHRVGQELPVRGPAPPDGFEEFQSFS